MDKQVTYFSHNSLVIHEVVINLLFLFAKHVGAQEKIVLLIFWIKVIQLLLGEGDVLNFY